MRHCIRSTTGVALSSPEFVALEAQKCLTEDNSIGKAPSIRKVRACAGSKSFGSVSEVTGKRSRNWNTALTIASCVASAHCFTNATKSLWHLATWAGLLVSLATPKTYSPLSANNLARTADEV